MPDKQKDTRDTWTGAPELQHPENWCKGTRYCVVLNTPDNEPTRIVIGEFRGLSMGAGRLLLSILTPSGCLVDVPWLDVDDACV